MCPSFSSLKEKYQGGKDKRRQDEIKFKKQRRTEFQQTPAQNRQKNSKKDHFLAG